MSDITRKVAEATYGSLEYLVFEIESQLTPRCESPIEMILGTTLGVVLIMSSAAKDRWSKRFLCVADDINQPNTHISLVPQYKWSGYRIDFAISIDNGSRPRVFIECDGHDFHERTKEQAARDRLKDRKIQEANIPILRFTGSEIYRDPVGCAGQIIEFINTRRAGD
jgi:very-short-patch-repair endonuclease